MEQKTYALGQRYIGAGQSEGTIILNEVPGNALGAYLDGANIIVNCSAQDATGDTMNAGEITIHGSTGDAAGYAMRGGAIYVQGDAGYRAGIHMKEYKEKVPVLVIGGRTGSFLGEYLAGGVIVPMNQRKSWDELPKEAKAYVEFLEKQLGHEIQFVSTGAEREKFVLKGAWL